MLHKFALRTNNNHRITHTQLYAYVCTVSLNYLESQRSFNITLW